MTIFGQLLWPHLLVSPPPEQPTESPSGSSPPGIFLLWEDFFPDQWETWLCMAFLPEPLSHRVALRDSVWICVPVLQPEGSHSFLSSGGEGRAGTSGERGGSVNTAGPSCLTPLLKSLLGLFSPLPDGETEAPHN